MVTTGLSDGVLEGEDVGALLGLSERGRLSTWLGLAVGAPEPHVPKVVLSELENWPPDATCAPSYVTKYDPEPYPQQLCSERC